MLKYDAILFDFDGTLADSNFTVYEAYLSTFKYFNSSADDSHIEKVVNQHLSYEETFRRIFGKVDIDPEIDSYLRKVYLHKLTFQASLFIGVKEVIKQIELLNCPWGIVTSKKKEFVHKIITLTNLSKKYACLICEEDVKHQKPHSASLMLACSVIGKKPQNMIYVGDMSTDIQAAKNCGMQSVAVSYGYGFGDFESALSSGATYVITNISEIIQILFKKTHAKTRFQN